MSTTDLIAEQLTVMRNAVRAGKKEVIIKRSSLIEKVIELFKQEGFIENYKTIEDNKQGKIKIYLRYLEDGRPVMTTLKRVSTPGRRHYIQAKGIKRVLGGIGFAIISTSKGLLTDKEAQEKGLGGEVICKIW